MLSKGKSLCPAELRPALLDLSKSALTGGLVFLSTHGHVAGGRAAKFMVVEEGTVSSIQDVDFRIGEIGVTVSIAGTIFVTNVFGPVQD